MPIDLTELGTLAGGIATLVAGFATYQRMNRVSNARADETVAAANAGAAKHEGQADELKTLRERLDTQEALSKAQDTRQGELVLEMAGVKATMLALGTHVSNVLLCEACKHHNKHIIEAINALVNDILKRPKSEPSKPDN